MAGSNLKSWPKECGYPKTCPASRHAAMIANAMRHKSKDGFGRLLRDAGYDVEHMADSIESAVVSLWKARQFLEWRELPPTKRYPLANGHWVPIIPKDTQHG